MNNGSLYMLKLKQQKAVKGKEILAFPYKRKGGQETWLEKKEFGTATGNLSRSSSCVEVSPISSTCPSIGPAWKNKA